MSEAPGESAFGGNGRGDGSVSSVHDIVALEVACVCDDKEGGAKYFCGLERR